MTSAHNLTVCPFVAGPKIIDLRLFVGRTEELRKITNHINDTQPVSVNVTGERRIGKSSLLYALTQLWDQYLPPQTRQREPVVVYLDLQEIDPTDVQRYYRAILDALRERSVWQRFPGLQRALRQCAPNHDEFRNLLEQCKAKSLLPVICLDEFEVLFRYPQVFNDAFFDTQRSYMNASTLMFVIASRQPLDHYRRKQRLTSAFFNLGHVLRLGELKEEEAADLARLPASTVPGAPAALSTEEQRLVRKWGGRHPYLLQLAGYYLCQARQQGRDVAWAHEQFMAEKNRLPRRVTPGRVLAAALRVLWDLPLSLGRLARGLQKNSEDLKDRLTGIAMILLFLLTLLGVLNRDLLQAWIDRVLGITP